MKNNAILLAVIGALIIAVGTGMFFTGMKVQKAKDDTAIATAPRDTVWVSHTVTLPAVPPKRSQGKPAQLQKSDSIEVQRLIDEKDSCAARADSLEQVIWQLATPFVTETKTPAGVIRVLSLPLQKQTEVAFDPAPMEVQVPKVTIKVPVPVPEPWYENPLYFAGGVVVGAVIVLVAN
jgi:hypothetical protein